MENKEELINRLLKEGKINFKEACVLMEGSIAVSKVNGVVCLNSYDPIKSDYTSAPF